MKSSVLLPLVIAGLIGSGCIFHRHPAAVKPAPGGAAATGGSAVMAEPIVTPGSPETGTVATYNATGRFVVVGFSAGHVPAVGLSRFLYRNGLKVAEIRITGPQRDTYTVADVVTGDAQTGDEVRTQ